MTEEIQYTLDLSFTFKAAGLVDAHQQVALLLANVKDSKTVTKINLHETKPETPFHPGHHGTCRCPKPRGVEPDNAAHSKA